MKGARRAGRDHADNARCRNVGRNPDAPAAFTPNATRLANAVSKVILPPPPPSPARSSPLPPREGGNPRLRFQRDWHEEFGAVFDNLGEPPPLPVDGRTPSVWDA